MTKFVGVKAKTYSYLVNLGSEDKSAKITQKCVIKRKLIFANYKNCFEATQFETKINIDSLKQFIKRNKSQQRFKSERHNVFTEKIALSSNDDKECNRSTR